MPLSLTAASPAAHASGLAMLSHQTANPDERPVLPRPVWFLTVGPPARCSFRIVDTKVLAALVPELLAVHPGIDWEFTETTEGLAVDIRPASDPSRCARIFVSASTEVFSYSFAGYHVAEFAYDLEEKREVLEDKINEAVSAVLGPTQVLLEWAGQEVVRSAISHDAFGEPPAQFTTSFPLSRLWWWVRGRRFRREVVTFPDLAQAE